MDSVMKIVAPDGLQAIAALVRLKHDFWVVFVGFSHQANLAAGFPRQGAYVFRDLRQDMLGGIIADGLYRVKPQAVEVILANPIEGVRDEVAAHLIATFLVVVDGVAPGRLMPVGEIRPE